LRSLKVSKDITDEKNKQTNKQTNQKKKKPKKQRNKLLFSVEPMVIDICMRLTSPRRRRDVIKKSVFQTAGIKLEKNM